MTRTKAALTMSIDALYERNKSVYMWTFTFPETLHVWMCPPAWNRLSKMLYNYYGRIEGVRVAEWHSGDMGHGLHFHCLMNVRMSVHIVRVFARRAGFGRVHVVRMPYEDRHYVAKYIGKQSEKIPFLKQWTAIGRGWHTRWKDLEFQSVAADAMRRAYKEAKEAGVPKGLRYGLVLAARNKALVHV